jgi:glutathione S-transferase
VPNYYRVLSQYYSDCGGPFLLGDRITYADFVVFQSIDNDEKIGTLPVCENNICSEQHAFSANFSAFRRTYQQRWRNSDKRLKAVLESKSI